MLNVLKTLTPIVDAKTLIGVFYCEIVGAVTKKASANALASLANPDLVDVEMSTGVQKLGAAKASKVGIGLEPQAWPG